MTDINEGQVSPILIEFLDADSFDDKYKILVANNVSDFDDLLIDNMASSIDTVINDGPIDIRYQDLKNALRTMAKYDVTRLR